MTFLNPLFLLGTVLVAVPILIHLWFRKRLKRIPFSALQFLKITEARRFGWLKLREWLILAARCLFILFLFLSLARPNLRTSVFKIGRLSSVFVIIDNSYSMAYGRNFERMKNIALQVVSMYSSNSEFCIVPLCSTMDSIGTIWVSGKSAKHAVQLARLAYGQASMSAALSKTPAREAKYDVEYVYIGDGQASNFRGFEAETTGEGTFYWVKVPAGGNAGIQSVSLKDPVAIPLDDYALEVAVVNHSRGPWSGKIGIAGGDYYDEQAATVQSGAESRYEFRLPIEVLTGEVTIYDDSLATDNVYYFRKGLPGLLRVLVIGDSPYIMQALTLQSGSNEPFVVQTAEQLGTRDLRDYDILVLDGVQSISENERLRIEDHLSKPETGLVITLEGGVAPNLAELLSNWCKIHDSVAPKGYVILDWIDNEHPIFKIFEGSGALRDVQCYRYVQTEAKSGVIARFSSGDPFIVINDNVAVISTSLNEQNTSFVYNRSFVPVMLRLLVNTVQGHERTEYYVGERMVQGGSMKTPTGELLRAGDEFRIPGFYSVDGETVCVNVRPEEGNLEILGPERARILSIEQLDPRQDMTGSDLSSFFLILALLSLLLELGLIWLH